MRRHTTFLDIAEEMPVFKIDADYVVKTRQLPTPADRAAEILDALTKELAENEENPAYKGLGERLERLATEHDAEIDETARKLEVRRDGPARGTRIEHERAGALLRVRVAPGAGDDVVRRGLERWVRGRARRALEARIQIRSREMHVQAGRLLVMDQRTKWGNCSALGNLSFNWRLVLAPPEVLDYLVVHELAHLLVPAHTAKFWLLVRSFCPAYERQRDWLKRHARELLGFLARKG